MRMIDADYVLTALDGISGQENMSFLGAYQMAREIVKGAPTVWPPKRESRKMLPCKCGCNRREHWFGMDTAALVCKRCGFKASGKNETDAVRAWNRAVSGDGDENRPV